MSNLEQAIETMRDMRESYDQLATLAESVNATLDDYADQLEAIVGNTDESTSASE